MKKLNYFFAAALVCTVAFWSSCSKKSSDNTTVDLTPVIHFVGDTGYVSADVSLPVNTKFKVGITAFSNSNSGTKLVDFKVTRVINNNPAQLFDTTFSNTSFNLNITSTTNSQVGQEKWFFRVTDKNGQYKEISFTITTTADLTPVLNFVTSSGYVNTNTTLTVNSPFKTGITALSNTTSGAKLARLMVTRTFNSTATTVIDSVFDTNFYYDQSF